jgi:hypothetical protein
MTPAQELTDENLQEIMKFHTKSLLNLRSFIVRGRHRGQIPFKNFSATLASNPGLIEWKYALSYFKRSFGDQRRIWN